MNTSLNYVNRSPLRKRKKTRIKPGEIAKPQAPELVAAPWAELQLGEYIIDLQRWKMEGCSLEAKRIKYFSRPFYIGRSSWNKMTQGRYVHPRIIKRFARGLRLSRIDRAELFIRWAELHLGAHTQQQPDIDSWLRDYQNDPATTVSHLTLDGRLRPKAARKGLASWVRGHLMAKNCAAYFARLDGSPLICDEAVAREATMRSLAAKLGVFETSLHDSLTECTLSGTTLFKMEKVLALTDEQCRHLRATYVQSLLARQILFLKAEEIIAHFDPSIHVRLAHWLAAADVGTKAVGQMQTKIAARGHTGDVTGENA